MDIELREGIYLHLIPTHKFKTIECTIHFVGQLDERSISGRSLLSNLMTESTVDFPTPAALKQRLANLYGTDLSSNVSRIGQRHLLNIHLSLADEHYTKERYIEEALAILHDIVFKPHLMGSSFDENIFEMARRQLIDQIKDIYNDKRAYAVRQTQQTYFEDEAQRMPAIGQVSDLENIQLVDLQMIYQNMCLEDEIHIYVLGAVDEDWWYEYFKTWPLAGRELISGEIRYHQSAPKNVQRKGQSQHIQQAKLIMAFNDQNQEATPEELMVFNGVFGGDAHSKLFKQIREKENLAYYAYSSISLSRAQMLVDMGIDNQNKAKAEQIVLEELDKIVQQEVTDQELIQTKKSLTNQIYQSADNPLRMINRHLSATLLGCEQSEAEQIACIDKVSRADIARIAGQMIISTVFVLRSEVDDENEEK